MQKLVFYITKCVLIISNLLENTLLKKKILKYVHKFLIFSNTLIYAILTKYTIRNMWNTIFNLFVLWNIFICYSHFSVVFLGKYEKKKTKSPQP